VVLEVFRRRNVIGLRRRETLSGPDLAVVESAHALDSQWIIFYFDTVRGSAGKRFYFHLEPADHSQDGSLASDRIAATCEMSYKAYSLEQFRYAARSAQVTKRC